MTAYEDPLRRIAELADEVDRLREVNRTMRDRYIKAEDENDRLRMELAALTAENKELIAERLAGASGAGPTDQGGDMSDRPVHVPTSDELDQIDKNYGPARVLGEFGPDMILVSDLTAALRVARTVTATDDLLARADEFIARAGPNKAVPKLVAELTTELRRRTGNVPEQWTANGNTVWSGVIGAQGVEGRVIIGWTDDDEGLARRIAEWLNDPTFPRIPTEGP